jgi:hypothetical protein
MVGSAYSHETETRKSEEGGEVSRSLWDHTMLACAPRHAGTSHARPDEVFGLEWRSVDSDPSSSRAVAGRLITASGRGHGEADPGKIVWMRSFLGELGYSLGASSLLLVDNQSAIQVTRNPEHHGRMKHRDLRFFWLATW